MSDLIAAAVSVFTIIVVLSVMLYDRTRPVKTTSRCASGTCDVFGEIPNVIAADVAEPHDIVIEHIPVLVWQFPGTAVANGYDRHIVTK